MTSKLIDMERLVSMGWGVLEMEAQTFKERGDAMMKFFVMSEEHGYDVVFVPDFNTDDVAAAKNIIAHSIRKMVAERQADAVCVFSDTWAGALKGPEADAATIKTVDRIGVRHAAELGLIRKREALLFQINTRIESVALVWYYRREGKQIIMEETKRRGGQASGRYVELFEPLPEARA